MFENSERESWLSVHVLSKGHGIDTEPTRVEHCGYILFKGRKWFRFIQIIWQMQHREENNF